MTESMNRLASILPATQVLVGVDATSKKRAFEEAGLLFEGLHGLSRALITDSLFARERLGSTGLGHGVAIPHGRIKGLKQAAGAVIRLQTPIPFDSPDGKPVTLLFVLLVALAQTVVFPLHFFFCHILILHGVILPGQYRQGRLLTWCS